MITNKQFEALTPLTGRRRFKKSIDDCFDDVLVLQVEYTKFTMKGWKCYWRDATPDDITSAEEVV